MKEKFKVGEVVVIDDLVSICKKTDRTKSSFNSGFFDDLSGKRVRITMIKGNDMYKAIILDECKGDFPKGSMLKHAGAHLFKKIGIELPDNLFRI